MHVMPANSKKNIPRSVVLLRGSKGELVAGELGIGEDGRIGNREG